MSKALILCLDVSGSMSTDAKVKDNDGVGSITAIQLESHSARTMVEAVYKYLPETQLGIVTFDSDIFVIQQPTKNYDKNDLCDKLMNIRDGTCTNIWGAIETSIGMAKNLITKNVYVDIFLFTDGVPTDEMNPCNGIVNELKNIMPQKNCAIHTFGIGPDIDSKLLAEIADVGNGLFKYISSPDMVGTCVINSACKFVMDDTQLSKSFDVPIIKKIIDIFENKNSFNEENILQARKLIDSIPKTHPLFKDKEQLTIACSNSLYLSEWGMHYFRTLNSCHKYKHCGNFKDSGLQDYADKKFQQMQNNIEKIFKHIKAPKSNSDMSVYVNPCGGCVSVDDLITMSDGKTKKPAGSLVGGDCILSTDGKIGIVNWVLICDGITELISFNDKLHITKWHPIRTNGEWKYPNDYLQETNDIKMIQTNTKVVTFSLTDSNTYSFFVNDIECVTLAHNITDSILNHNFYGTDKVIDYMKTLYIQQKGCNNVVYDDIVTRSHYIALKCNKFSIKNTWPLYNDSFGQWNLQNVGIKSISDDIYKITIPHKMKNITYIENINKDFLVANN